METLIILMTGVLVSVAVYLLLSRTLVRVIIGTSLLSHAVHLLLLTMGGLKKGGVPIIGEKTATFTDALPQALILTAIVINFGVTALFLVLAYRTYEETGTEQLDRLRGMADE